MAQNLLRGHVSAVFLSSVVMIFVSQTPLPLSAGRTYGLGGPISLFPGETDS